MEMIIDFLKGIFSFILGIFEFFYNRFRDLSLFDKAIVLMIIPAFFAIIMPVARYYIFGTYFYVNNPLAVHLIGIVLVMFLTFYIPEKFSLTLRLLLNAFFLFWIVYIHFSTGIIKAPYELTPGYYLNIVIPVLYITSSSLSFIYNRP